MVFSNSNSNLLLIVVLVSGKRKSENEKGKRRIWESITTRRYTNWGCSARGNEGKKGKIENKKGNMKKRDNKRGRWRK